MNPCSCHGPAAGVRYSGVFLYEDSRIGSLQQIDLVA
jgi:hypothetical protein